MHLGVNDDVGSFEIQLPQQKGASYYYNDIVIGDRIKVWLSWSTPDTTVTPTFMGRVSQIISDGQLKTLKGKSNSEILSRRIKARKVWTATQADDIVAEVVSDLSLGGDLATDTSLVTITEDSETYADILRKVSDYWVSAGTQVKKDYYVDNGDVAHSLGHLVWKARPARTVGVETLSETNILQHVLTCDGLNLKNAIGVYGRLTSFNPKDSEIYGRKYPTDGDSWTYDANWTAVAGTVASNNTSVKIGTTCTRGTVPAGGTVTLTHSTGDVSSVEGLQGYGAIEMWTRCSGLLNPVIRIYAPDSSNYFVSDDVTYTSADIWEFTRLALGKNNEYNAETNPSGQWQIGAGTPDWNQMDTLCIEGAGVAGKTLDIDGLCFNFGRWRYVPASDATSITDYNEHDLIVTDDNLTSDSECEARAKTLLYKGKDPVKRLDITVIGNTNILLGDQLSMTLTSEGISATNYYVTTVEHELNGRESWTTKAILLDTVSCRDIPPATTDAVIVAAIKNLQQGSRNVRRVN